LAAAPHPSNPQHQQEMTDNSHLPSLPWQNAVVLAQRNDLKMGSDMCSWKRGLMMYAMAFATCDIAEQFGATCCVCGRFVETFSSLSIGTSMRL